MKIEITQKQWEMIQRLMATFACSQEEAVTHLMMIGMRETDFREEYQ
jgi:hypothetical protein